MHCGASLINQLTAGIDIFVDQSLDFLRRRDASLGQVAHFRGHYSKAAPMLTCARRFDCSIER